MNLGGKQEFGSFEGFHQSPFDFIRQKLANGQIVRSYVDPEKQDMASQGNIIMSYVDRNGQTYDIEVYYDEDEMMIYPPS